MEYRSFFYTISIILIICIADVSYAQDPHRLQSEVNHLDSIVFDFDKSEDVIVFTGSSSIRKWDSLLVRFPKKQIINTGFGGSQMSDLLYYKNEIIIKYSPNKVFIYEGDNDIAYGKNVNQILSDTRLLIENLNNELNTIEVYFISAKPSLARWELEDNYIVFNKALEDYCSREQNLFFIDVWSIMLNEDGEPIDDLFIEDGLHLTEEGYEIWAKEIKQYLE